MLIAFYKTQEGRRYTGEQKTVGWQLTMWTSLLIVLHFSCSSGCNMQHSRSSSLIPRSSNGQNLPPPFADAAFIIPIQCYARSKLVQSKESYLARDGLSLTWQFHLKAFKVCRRCTNFARLPHLHAVNQYPAEIKEIKALALQTIFSNIRHCSQGLRGIQPTVFLLFLPYGFLFYFFFHSFLFFSVRWIVGGG